MYDVVNASKQDDYLHKYKMKYRIFLLFNCTYFFWVLCALHVLSETMLYCIQTIYCKGSGESAHM